MKISWRSDAKRQYVSNTGVVFSTRPPGRRISYATCMFSRSIPSLCDFGQTTRGSCRGSSCSSARKYHGARRGTSRDCRPNCGGCEPAPDVVVEARRNPVRIVLHGVGSWVRWERDAERAGARVVLRFPNRRSVAPSRRVSLPSLGSDLTHRLRWQARIDVAIIHRARHRDVDRLPDSSNLTLSASSGAT